MCHSQMCTLADNLGVAANVAASEGPRIELVVRGSALLVNNQVEAVA